ncbi:hypothetical protein [Leucobacter japonicus]|uniref:hypothetical protein n=1 Tax=Leucobacter japonicus TaxID=1461259 RepID=UPI0006A76F63|nr:hypothetical protein [Leucobacter japonicus]
MSKDLGHFSRRYAVEIGSQAYIGMEPTYVDWAFDRGFKSLSDAEAYADRAAEDNEFVRVIDREVS